MLLRLNTVGTTERASKGTKHGDIMPDLVENSAAKVSPVPADKLTAQLCEAKRLEISTKRRFLYEVFFIRHFTLCLMSLKTTSEI